MKSERIDARLRIEEESDKAYPAAVIDSVEGMILPAEARLLFQLATRTRAGCIVEIGSYRGKSTAALALGARQGVRPPVFAVEPHEEFTGVLGGQFGAEDRVEFFKNMLQVGCLDLVRLINLPSGKAARCWDWPIGLLWIDGDHRYENVKEDFDGFARHVLPQGRVVFHDSDLGPADVICAAVSSGLFQEEQRVASTIVLRRVS